MSWNSTTESSVSRLGQSNGAGNARNLFLKQFSGEVLTAFQEKNVAMPLHRVRTISNGKSAQFPSIGTTTAAYHSAGEVIYGGSVPAKEITVTVDDLLVSSAFIPKIDEAMNHYDVRSIYSSELGNALANAADKNIFSTIYRATIGGTNSGDLEAQWTDADFAGLSDTNSGVGSVDGQAGRIDLNLTDDEGSAAPSAAQIVDGIMNSLMQFDKHDVGGEKSVVLDATTYYTLMAGDSRAINRDFGGTGGIVAGTVPTIGGAKIYMSNNLPDAAQGTTPSTESGRAADIYTGANNANLKGMVFTKDAAATVKLLDLGVESEYQIDRQGTLMVAKYAMGHNVLRHKSAIALVA
jgi:hypothetical protein